MSDNLRARAIMLALCLAAVVLVLFPPTSSLSGAQAGPAAPALSYAGAASSQASRASQASSGAFLHHALAKMDAHASSGVATTYVVLPGDGLSSIAANLYGRADAWPLIYQANRNLITNPSVIMAGWHLKIPPFTGHIPAAPQPAAPASPAPSSGGTGNNSPPPPSSGGSYCIYTQCGHHFLSSAQVGQFWLAAGGPSWAESAAISIASCESGFDANNWNPSGASGLWQILGQVVSGNIFDPLVNAENAVSKFRASHDTFAQWICQASTQVKTAHLLSLLTSTATQLPTTLYRNPLRAISGLSRERIDQGVDYAGFGPIYALGRGVIVNLYGGWPCGIFIAERLTQGRLAGRYVYYSESIRPSVYIGEHVTTGTRIGWMYGGIETGWAAPPVDGHISMAMRLGEWDGWNSTRHGEMFSWLLHHLGAPPGVRV